MNKTGELSVLNVGAGDIVVTFNKHDTGESAKALRMLRDMQRQGYAILVQQEDGEYTRVVDIDATRGRYIIAAPDGEPEQISAHAEPVGPVEACGVTAKAEVDGTELVCVLPRFPAHSGKHQTAAGVEFKAPKGAKRKGAARKSRVGVPIKRARAVGVARSAGG